MRVPLRAAWSQSFVTNYGLMDEHHKLSPVAKRLLT